MRRLVVWLTGSYLLLAAAGRALERNGVVRCDCTDECWCKHPLLGGFRWVFPYGHG